MTEAQRISHLESSVRMMKQFAGVLAGIMFFAICVGAARTDTAEDLRTSKIVFVDPKTGDPIASFYVTEYGDLAIQKDGDEHSILFSLRKNQAVVQTMHGETKSSISSGKEKAAVALQLGDHKRASMYGIVQQAETTDQDASVLFMNDGSAKVPRIELRAAQPDGAEPSGYVILRDRFGESNTPDLIEK